MMRKVILCSAALLCLGVASAAALSEKPYLNAGDADFGSLLPPPPPDGSARDKRDMQTVLELQKEVTPERLGQIQADTEQSVYRLAGDVFGPGFTKEKFPLAGPFFDKVREDSAVGVRPIKQAYKRSRPFQANAAGVKPPANIAAASQSPTYPSGHSTFGAEAAFLLAMMVPEKKRELFERGWAYGEQRVASGVAYPSDWEGGHIGAAVMVALMMQKPEFRADFDAVKSEIRKGLGLKP
jgi:acid phosphatase (class A)